MAASPSCFSCLFSAVSFLAFFFRCSFCTVIAALSSLSSCTFFSFFFFSFLPFATLTRICDWTVTAASSSTKIGARPNVRITLPSEPMLSSAKTRRSSIGRSYSCSLSSTSSPSSPASESLSKQLSETSGRSSSMERSTSSSSSSMGSARSDDIFTALRLASTRSLADACKLRVAFSFSDLRNMR